MRIEIIIVYNIKWNLWDSLFKNISCNKIDLPVDVIVCKHL